MKKYWFFLLIAILLSSSSHALDRMTRKWIPDDLKRAKFYQKILFLTSSLYTIIMFFIMKNIFPLPVTLFLSCFPLVCVGLGTLYAWFKHKE